jgi:Sugar (pentulose and hexulose) kinases
MDPTARGVFLGLTARHGQPELVRAVLEGVTLACFDASRVLAEAHALPDRLVLAGGGARSPLWQRIVADVFGTPLRRLEVDEQAAIGACILAGAAVDLVDPATASRAWARLGGLVEPDDARHVRYLELLELFRDAYAANRAAFTSLRRFEAD